MGHGKPCFPSAQRQVHLDLNRGFRRRSKDCGRSISSFSSPQAQGPGSVDVFAQLIPLAGGNPVTIDRDVSVIGRQRETCDIVVDRKSVSKIHCVLVRTDGLLFVRDLFSTNGIKVNGQRIVRGALLPGDILSLASEKFRIHLSGSPSQVVPSNDARTEMFEIDDDDSEPEIISEPEDAPPRTDGSEEIVERPGMNFIVLPPEGIDLPPKPPEDLVE